jgi:hypothetical protein
MSHGDLWASTLALTCTVSASTWRSDKRPAASGPVRNPVPQAFMALEYASQASHLPRPGHGWVGRPLGRPTSNPASRMMSTALIMVCLLGMNFFSLVL